MARAELIGASPASASRLLNACVVQLDDGAAPQKCGEQMLVGVPRLPDAAVAPADVRRSHPGSRQLPSCCSQDGRGLRRGVDSAGGWRP